MQVLDAVRRWKRASDRTVRESGDGGSGGSNGSGNTNSVIVGKTWLRALQGAAASHGLEEHRGKLCDDHAATPPRRHPVRSPRTCPMVWAQGRTLCVW
jgi:hypothetical protein